MSTDLEASATSVPATGTSTTRSVRVAFAGVMAVSAALSLSAFQAKRAAIAFRGHDFAFFAAQYQRLFDSPAWTALPLHPSGRNVFGFSGVDGHPTLHHDIHASPLKYVLAAAFELTGSLLAVQAALLLTCLVALGYVMRRLTARANGPLVFGVVAMIALSPWFVRATCFDMRTYIALSPFVLVLATALLSRAPSSHLVTIALLGLVVREEAALLLALAAVYLALDGRRRDALRVYAIALAYIALFHVLYAGPLGFTYEPGASALGAAALCLLLPALWLAPSRARESAVALFEAHRTWAVLILSSPFLAVALVGALRGQFDNHAVERLFPAALIVLLASTRWIASRLDARAQHRVVLVTLAIAVLLCASSGASIAALRTGIVRRAGFWDVFASVPTDTAIVTDFDHYDAFAARERVLVWERAPARTAVAQSASIAARARLLARLRDGDVLLVVSPDSFRAIDDAMAAAGELDWRSMCVSNPALVVARTGDAVCPSAPRAEHGRSIAR